MPERADGDTPDETEGQRIWREALAEARAEFERS